MANVSSEAAAVVRVLIPSPLRSYTDGAAEVRVAVPVLAPEEPPTVAAVLAALEARCRGIRFRMVDEQGQLRPHIRLFVGAEPARSLDARVSEGRELMIVAALSGG
jgi:molybdopterin converting factor small subunit